jgi:predicted HicB family RNase H-like nuclease
MDGMALLHFQLDDELHAKAKAAAALDRVTLKDYVAQAIAEKLARDVKKR